MFSKLLALAMAMASVTAEPVPDYSSYGYGVVWQENFNGAAGQKVNTNNWNIIERSSNANNEWETYTSSSRMCIPLKSLGILLRTDE
jgi:hypothetical protein